MDSNNKGLLTVEEVRRKVFNNNASRASMYRWIQREEIPSKRIGGRVYIPAWYVKQMLEEPDQATN